MRRSPLARPSCLNGTFELSRNQHTMVTKRAVQRMAGALTKGGCQLFREVPAFPTKARRPQTTSHYFGGPAPLCRPTPSVVYPLPLIAETARQNDPLIRRKTVMAFHTLLHTMIPSDGGESAPIVAESVLGLAASLLMVFAVLLMQVHRLCGTVHDFSIQY